MSSSNSTSAGENIPDLVASLLSKPPHAAANSTNNRGQDNTGSHTQDNAASARGMSHTGAWKPALDRRQSWDAQEYKHDLLKRQYMDGEGGAAGKGSGGGGFSEV